MAVIFSVTSPLEAKGEKTLFNADGSSEGREGGRHEPLDTIESASSSIEFASSLSLSSKSWLNNEAFSGDDAALLGDDAVL